MKPRKPKNIHKRRYLLIIMFAYRTYRALALCDCVCSLYRATLYRVRYKVARWWRHHQETEIMLKKRSSLQESNWGFLTITLVLLRVLMERTHDRLQSGPVSRCGTLEVTEGKVVELAKHFCTRSHTK